MTAVAPATFALIEAELLAWCAERLSKAKRPHRVEIVDELPRTSVGKIRGASELGGERRRRVRRASPNMKGASTP